MINDKAIDATNLLELINSETDFDILVHNYFMIGGLLKNFILIVKL